MIQPHSPLHSLTSGHWFKLICGASFQDLPTIRNLTLAYSLAGADCIDVAADPAVIAVAREGLAVASQLEPTATPLLMASLNDGVDPHFRKAEFDPHHCPPDCPRPCAQVCPTGAISTTPATGVIDARCYGCGRCLPICPLGLIEERAYVSAPELVVPQLFAAGIDALEIHTHCGNEEGLARLWRAIQPWGDRLQLLAISFPDHPDLIPYLQTLRRILDPLPCPLLWQTDGRPMSGDIGKGTTHAAIHLAQKVLEANLPGFIQLAGGTNGATVPKLQQLGLLSGDRSPIAGVGYGSYARRLLAAPLEAVMERSPPHLEAHPHLLRAAIAQAVTLIRPLKAGQSSRASPQPASTPASSSTS